MRQRIERERKGPPTLWQPGTVGGHFATDFATGNQGLWVAPSPFVLSVRAHGREPYGLEVGPALDNSPEEDGALRQPSPGLTVEPKRQWHQSESMLSQISTFAKPAALNAGSASSFTLSFVGW